MSLPNDKLTSSAGKDRFLHVGDFLDTAHVHVSKSIDSHGTNRPLLSEFACTSCVDGVIPVRLGIAEASTTRGFSSRVS